MAVAPPRTVGASAIDTRVLAALPVGAVVHAPDSRIIQANHAAEQILGLTIAQMTGRTPMHPGWRTIHPDGSPFPGDAHPASVALATGEAVRDVVMGVHKPDGSLTWIKVNAVPVPTSDPEQDGSVVATFADITAEIELQHELSASQDRFRIVAENAADFVVEVDVERRVSWVSSSITAALAWTRDQLLGSDIALLLTPTNPAVEEFWRHVLTGEAVSGRTQIRHADGSLRWVERSVNPVKDRSGRVVSVVAAFHVIQQEVEAEEARAAADLRYRLLAENSTDVVLLIEGGVITYVSAAVTAAMGAPPEHWVGMLARDWQHPDDAAENARILQQVLAGGQVVSTRRLRDADGTYHWVELHAGPYLDAEGRIAGAVASLRVVDREVELQRALDDRARVDKLTGLLNRAEGLERLERLLAGNQRSGQRLAVVFCDIDGFKEINDTHGHLVGDAVLCAVAERVRSVVRGADLVVRFGGDEILAVLDGVHDLAQAVAVAEKICTQVAGGVEHDGVRHRVTLSVGVTVVEPDDDLDGVVARADAAMYRAKRAGKNRVEAAVTTSGPKAPTEVGAFGPPLGQGRAEISRRPAG